MGLLYPFIYLTHARIMGIVQFGNKLTTTEMKKHQLKDRIIWTRRYGQSFKEMVILRSGI